MRSTVQVLSTERNAFVRIEGNQIRSCVAISCSSGLSLSLLELYWVGRGASAEEQSVPEVDNCAALAGTLPANAARIAWPLATAPPGRPSQAAPSASTCRCDTPMLSVNPGLELLLHAAVAD